MTDQTPRRDERERSEKVKLLKALLKELHSGRDLSEIRQKFKNELSGIEPSEIPLIEQELVREGLPPSEIARMCELHVELFRESLVSREDLLELAPGHPLHTLLAENEEVTKDAEKMKLLAGMADGEGARNALSALSLTLKDLLSLKKHFVRLQLLIFPYMERRGITAVPRVLWTKQEELLEGLKKLSQAVSSKLEDDKSVSDIRRASEEVSKELIEMVFRENNILYPTLNALLAEGEWAAIQQNEELIGFYKARPAREWNPASDPVYPYQVNTRMTAEQIGQLPTEIRMMAGLADDYHLVRDGDIGLEDGYLSPQEINAILRTLPFDVSFVDADDRLRYYSSKDRVFARARTALGRRVQLCHPPTSAHLVTKIIEEFRAGRKSTAEFLIKMGDKEAHIRYLAIRGGGGEYLGTLEVVQEISHIRALRGEKRLLDWR